MLGKEDSCLRIRDVNDRLISVKSKYVWCPAGYLFQDRARVSL